MFLHLHQARFDYEPTRRLRPWLLTIAYNLKREYMRKCARRPEILTDREPELVVSDDVVERGSTAAHVRRAIEMLSDQQRDVIVMRWFDELSFGEISDILGISRSAAKVRAHRGYKALRELLHDDVAVAA